MPKRLSTELFLLIVVVAFILLVFTGGDKVIVEAKLVKVSMEFLEDDYYFVQFHLPKGQLMSTTTNEEWEGDTKSVKHLLPRKEKIGGVSFFGAFCGGGNGILVQSRVNSEDYRDLIFFAEDGSIWTIHYPDEVLCRQVGEITTPAAILRKG